MATAAPPQAAAQQVAPQAALPPMDTPAQAVSTGLPVCCSSCTWPHPCLHRGSLPCCPVKQQSPRSNHARLPRRWATSSCLSTTQCSMPPPSTCTGSTLTRPPSPMATCAPRASIPSKPPARRWAPAGKVPGRSRQHAALVAARCAACLPGAPCAVHQRSVSAPQPTGRSSIRGMRGLFHVLPASRWGTCVALPGRSPPPPLAPCPTSCPLLRLLPLGPLADHPRPCHGVGL